ncbi:hypothetical protein X772_30210 [Mesorhizobium sp. LSJC280B00]|nr:hypothetical protein X772_30210 [Mesorhizobium sp. LSJC280B00]
MARHSEGRGHKFESRRVRQETCLSATMTAPLGGSSLYRGRLAQRCLGVNHGKLDLVGIEERIGRWCFCLLIHSLYFALIAKLE